MADDINFVLLNEFAKLPTRGTPRAAGLDLYFPGPEPLIIMPGRRVRVMTGLACEMPDHHEGQIRPRSGMSERSGVMVILGTIDEDYTGEIGVLLLNTHTFPHTIHKHDRIAQLVIAHVAYPKPRQVATITKMTDRGSNGFGSTGR